MALATNRQSASARISSAEEAAAACGNVFKKPASFTGSLS